MIMKKLLAVLSLGFVGAAVAVPTVSVTSVVQNPATRALTIGYTLSGEAAVVTMGSVTTNGAAMAETDLLVVTGDANRLVQPGSHSLVWQPSAETGFGPFDANAVVVSLKAWSTNAPPDYMVIDLMDKARGVRYYTCKEAIPGGIGDDRYKTDYLVMRRIPAAGIVWRMGSPSTELGAANYRAKEKTQKVKLTEDYYCGVYMTTYRQTYWLNGASFLNGGNGGDHPAMNVLNWGWDWPQTDIQYCTYRGWFHEANCSYLKGLGDAQAQYENDEVYKYWPRDGHDIVVKSSDKCKACMSGTYNPTLGIFRNNYGFEFDFLSDAQWEFACRGGEANGGHALSSGKELEDVTASENLGELGWYSENSTVTHVTTTNAITAAMPHPVGQKKPNGYGLYDMHGLMFEAVLDEIADHLNTDEVLEDPKGGTSPCLRSRVMVARGGSFCTIAQHCRVARRENNSVTSLWNDYHNAKVQDGNKIFSRSKGYRFWLPCKAVK